MLPIFFKFFRKHSWLIKHDVFLIVLIFLGIICFSFLEGIGIGLIAPLLDEGGESSKKIPILGELFSVFDNYDRSEQVILVGKIMLVVIVVRGMVQYGLNLLKIMLPLRVSKRLMKFSFNRMIHSNLAYIYSKKLGEHSVVISSLSNQISASITAFINLVSSFFILFVYTAMMFMLSWKLALIAMASLTLISLAIKHVIAKPIVHATQHLNDRTILQNIFLSESIIGSYIVRLKANENQRFKGFGEVLDKTIRASFSKQIWSTVPSVLLSVLAGSMVCLLIIGIADLNRENDGDWLSLLILFIIILFRLLSPVSEIISSYAKILSIEPVINKVEGYWHEAEKSQQKSGQIKVSGIANALEFTNVSFNYKGSEIPALKNVSFRLNRGKKIALVGGSGGGKSTLVNLLMGFYAPTSGQIELDGTPLPEIDIYQWRSKIGMVEQDPFFFNTSVRENLIFGHNDVNEDQIWNALKISGATEFVNELEKKIDTDIGDRGVKLSGGQKQRLAIARAILGNPDIIIFDEATSQLDSLTEASVQKSISNLPSHISMLTIAHRLSTVTNADEIIVLVKGSISQRGTHSQLMKEGGVYREMVEHQEFNTTNNTSIVRDC